MLSCGSLAVRGYSQPWPDDTQRVGADGDMGCSDPYRLGQGTGDRMGKILGIPGKRIGKSGWEGGKCPGEGGRGGAGVFQGGRKCTASSH